MKFLMNDLDHWILPLPTQWACTVQSRPRAPLPNGRDRPTVKKKTAVIKRAVTEKRERWQNKEWCGRPESHRRQLAGDGVFTEDTVAATC